MEPPLHASETPSGRSGPPLCTAPDKGLHDFDRSLDAQKMVLFVGNMLLVAQKSRRLESLLRPHPPSTAAAEHC